MNKARVRVTLTEPGVAGDYLVAERHEDGSLLLAPDTSIEAIRRRHNLKSATLGEFETEYGPVLSPDGEG
jgi:hypothetical protein